VPTAQVVVNLYPFRATVTRSPPPPFEEGVENIDIGGPAMIRAAAKNHGDVTVIVDPADYAELLSQLSSAEGVSQEFRKKMAWKAYQHTASYDAQVWSEGRAKQLEPRTGLWWGGSWTAPLDGEQGTMSKDRGAWGGGGRWLGGPASTQPATTHRCAQGSGWYGSMQGQR
jgi:hypothetical protein